tara:strand:- start:7041 stop:7556 length:516 start_codon:yes stop_codon:yes gene_type:complete
MNLKSKSVTLFIIIFLVSACSQLEIVPRKSDPVLEGRIADDKPLINVGEDKKSLTELILGERTTSVELSGSITFQTALDKVNFMPLASVDSASGIIITDWYNIEDNNLRVKLNIRIHDQNMNPDSLTVQVFKQSFDGQKWIDQGNDEIQSAKIKASILEDSRVLQSTIDLL